MSENIISDDTIVEGVSFKEYKELCEDDSYSPGWEQIDLAFKEVYGDQEPSHFGTVLTSRAMFGGNEFLDGYSLFKSENGYYHLVTYGLSELYANPEAFGGDYSKWGYELTMKIKAETIEECYWAINMLGNLARYTFNSDRYIEAGHYIMGDGSPLELESESKITSLVTDFDTEVKSRDTVHGRLDFIQVVGITWDDAQKIYDGESVQLIQALLKEMKKENPNLVTDMDSSTTYL